MVRCQRPFRVKQTARIIMCPYDLNGSAVHITNIPNTGDESELRRLVVNLTREHNISKSVPFPF
jgi:uncharacterized protein (UPF0371 family)